MLQFSFKSLLLQELLLSGTHYQTPSPRWLRYHPSEASCLLHHARRRAHSIAEISARRLAIIIQMQIQIARFALLLHATCLNISPSNRAYINASEVWWDIYWSLHCKFMSSVPAKERWKFVDYTSVFGFVDAVCVRAFMTHRVYECVPTSYELKIST